jgi:hypothetical protein
MNTEKKLMRGDEGDRGRFGWRLGDHLSEYMQDIDIKMSSGYALMHENDD